MHATSTTMSVQQINSPNFVMNLSALDHLSILLSPIFNTRRILLKRLSSLIDPILNSLMIIGLLTGLVII